MRIVIAPNAFKNSLDATKVAEAIAKGLQESKLDCSTICFPVGDGGDGTASVLVQHLKGKNIAATVSDPLGRKIKTSFGLVDQGKTAVIALADASGLKLLKAGEYAPVTANTYGTGELILKALDEGVKKIIIGIGGSATVDAGTGMLQALGVKFYDAAENELSNLPGSLVDLNTIDITGMDKRLSHTEMIVLCDVANPLLGDSGAASIFGPQKGASLDDVLELEKALTQLRNIVLAETGEDMAEIKHGGAAGGVAAGLHSFLQAKLVNGIDHFLDLTDFNATLQNADLVITGEGSIDSQTLEGKAPTGVAKRSRERSIPVICFAGKIPLHPDTGLQQYFDVLIPINNEVTDLPTALENTFDNLVRAAKMMGDLLQLQKR